MRVSKSPGCEPDHGVLLALFAFLANIGEMSVTMFLVPADVKTLGEAIRRLREAQGMTLRALAEKVGVTPPFLSDLEHDRRKTDRLDRFAEVLGTPIEELQRLDTRISSEMKDWLGENPQLLAMLREFKSSGRPVPIDQLRLLFSSK